jgi:quercetin dioxygenase-like cupin family protein
MSPIHHDYKTEVRYSSEGPLPRVWLSGPGLKVVLIGLEPGQQAGPHAGPAAVYHILEGSGWATIGETRESIGPGATIVAEDGVVRGIEAETRLAFLGTRVP